MIFPSRMDADIRRHGAVHDSPLGVIPRDTADVRTAGNAGVSKPDVLHCTAIQITKKACIILTISIDADAADGVALSIEGTGE